MTFGRMRLAAANANGRKRRSPFRPFFNASCSGWNASAARRLTSQSMQGVCGMKSFVACAVVAVVVAGAAGQADAKGCIKGAVVGGIAGHLAHHHGLLGAAAGCVIGHHEAAKKARTNNQ